MKVLGFSTVFYCGAYFRESLESIVSHCDKVVIAYTRQPSQGHGSPISCPDSEGYIFDIAQSVLGDKLIWDCAERYGAENEHRAVKHKYSKGFDLVLTADTDEVFSQEDLPKALQYAMNGQAQYYGIDGYVNFWKSFNRACYDGYRPIRIERMDVKDGSQDLNCKCTIYHFSCAQPEYIMRFKYGVFGHAHEVRRGWLENTYFGWTPETRQLHCVSEQIWDKAEPFDKTTLPDNLKRHRFYNLESI